MLTASTTPDDQATVRVRSVGRVRDIEDKRTMLVNRVMKPESAIKRERDKRLESSISRDRDIARVSAEFADRDNAAERTES